MVGKKLRKFVFVLKSISDFLPTPPSLFKNGGVTAVHRWVREVVVEINLPRKKQRVKTHPFLAGVLLREIPELSVKRGGLPCGKNGDFARALLKGKENLGHTLEHVLAWAQEKVCRAFGDEREFVYQTRILEAKRHSIAYQVLMFCGGDEPPPSEFFGLEGIICGYFNALLEERPFDIREKVGFFIEHRTEQDVASRTPDDTEGLPPQGRTTRLSGLRRRLCKAVACFFFTS